MIYNFKISVRCRKVAFLYVVSSKLQTISQISVIRSAAMMRKMLLTSIITVIWEKIRLKKRKIITDPITRSHSCAVN